MGLLRNNDGLHNPLRREPGSFLVGGVSPLDSYYSWEVQMSSFGVLVSSFPNLESSKLDMKTWIRTFFSESLMAQYVLNFCFDATFFFDNFLVHLVSYTEYPLCLLETPPDVARLLSSDAFTQEEFSMYISKARNFEQFLFCGLGDYTLPETNSSHLGPPGLVQISFLLGWATKGLFSVANLLSVSRTLYFGSCFTEIHLMDQPA